MKILASILAVTSADYACCPYDDFGVRYIDCPLTEKTPWSDSGTAPGVENNACKAWEANIDATMEGNSDNDNWGGCGFQRHFPWSMEELAFDFTPATDARTSQHCLLGMLSTIDCAGSAAKTSLYDALEVAGLADTDFSGTTTNFKLSDGTGSFSAQGENIIFGRVTLGAICKLFIPVSFKHIETVSIAGVHMTSGGVLNARISNVAGDAFRTGTAYCFSVVNVAEYMENSNKIGNANVAGLNANNAIVTNNDQTDDVVVPIFGQKLVEDAAQTTDPLFISGGANFDVVVHFKSDWCIRHWSIVDMQTGGDKGHLETDYDLTDDAGVPQHAHTDVADKRFQAGIEGCGDGTDSHDSLATGLTPSALGCKVYTDSGDVQAINTYLPSLSFNWPNAGAWAAFYSFVSCSDDSKMIYKDSAGAISDRMVVLSSFYNDFRHQGTQSVRGNVRQVGLKVETCGPGVLRDQEADKRCTWNWNFGAEASQAAPSFQDWFESQTPHSFNSWNNGLEIDRFTEDKAFDTPNTNAVFGEGYTAPAFSPFTFTLTLNTHDSTGGLTAATVAFGDIEFDSKHVTIASSMLVTVACVQPADRTTDPFVDATDNVRDVFPECFMGDEIHFQFPTISGEHVTSWFSSVAV